MQSRLTVGTFPDARSRSCALALLLAVASLATVADAATWNENVNGDLSNTGFSPSLLNLDAGSNVITGNFGAPDLDYITLVVPAGFTLSAIVTGTGNLTGLSRSFIGLQAGPVMTVAPSASSALGLLGWTHFSGADGVDLLPAIGVAKNGSTGFSGPLAAGMYTFWFNETSSDAGLHYDFDFRVTPVPIPASLPLLLCGLAALRRLRTQQR